MQYPPIDRWNQNPLRCPQPPISLLFERYGLHTLLLIIRCRFRSYCTSPHASVSPHARPPVFGAMPPPHQNPHSGPTDGYRPHNAFHALSPHDNTVPLIHHHNTLIRQPSAQVISTLLIPPTDKPAVHNKSLHLPCGGIGKALCHRTSSHKTPSTRWTKKATCMYWHTPALSCCNKYGSPVTILCSRI